MADEKKKKKSEPKLVPDRKQHEKDGLHMALRVALGTAGLCLMVGFVFPWLKLGPNELSGLELVSGGNLQIREAIGNARWILLLVPVFGLALTAIGFLGFRWSGAVGLGVSVLIIGYGVFTVVYLFFQVTGYGLWIVLAGSLMALIVGAVSVLRSRRGPKAEAEDDDEPSPASPPPPEKTPEAA